MEEQSSEPLLNTGIGSGCSIRSAKSTISFADAYSKIYPSASNVYIGGVLDAKVHSMIDSIAIGVSNVHAYNNGPTYGIVLHKQSNSLYGGIVFGYSVDILYIFKYIGNFQINIFEHF